MNARRKSITVWRDRIRSACQSNLWGKVLTRFVGIEIYDVVADVRTSFESNEAQDSLEHVIHTHFLRTRRFSTAETFVQVLVLPRYRRDPTLNTV